MNCLEKYRSKLIREINRDLGIIVTTNEADAVHDFRVGIKRLTALYLFLNQIDPELNAKRLIKPYRALSKSIGNIRDCDIAVETIGSLDEINPQDSKNLIKALRLKANRDYRLFQKMSRAQGRLSIRMPTIKSTVISAHAITRHKPLVLNRWLSKILTTSGRMSAGARHKQRILLKRYRHVLDAFAFCPGHRHIEAELKQIKVLEQLLGDWHDRVVTAELIKTLPGVEASTVPAVAIMQRQERLLLGAAKIYLRKFSQWHQNT